MRVAGALPGSSPCCLHRRGVMSPKSNGGEVENQGWDPGTDSGVCPRLDFCSCPSGRGSEDRGSWGHSVLNPRAPELSPE